jgi:hypothetical protein
MKVAFDLDGTLIPTPGFAMPVERLGFLARAVSDETIRAGAPQLLKELHRRGHDVWLYTTSMRNPARLWLWFASFGVRLGGVVNHARHSATLAHSGIACSKYPPAFGIDLLVDNEEGTIIEGKRFGFAVLHIAEGDDAWCSRVRAAVFRSET